MIYENGKRVFVSKEYRFEKAIAERKMEINLYWKRATYFWTFIGVAFAGYGISLTEKYSNSEGLHFFQFIIILIGIVFSFSWYLVNKGSKFWQENWEHHVDLIEKELFDKPLYRKILIKRESFEPVNPKYFSFSVSKINQMLSFFIFIVWIIILLYYLYNIEYMYHQSSRILDEERFKGGMRVIIPSCFLDVFHVKESG